MKFRKAMKSCKLLLTVSLVLVAQVLLAQTREELEKKREAKLKEIEFTQNLLNKTDKEEKRNLNYLIILGRQIRNRQELIITINKEVDLLAKNIEDTKIIISALERDLEALRQEYAQMMYFAFKNKSEYDYLVFIFASESLNQAWRRTKLLSYYADARETQIELIRATFNSLQSKIERLQKQIGEKKNLMSNLEQEKKQLEADKKSKNRLILALREKESEYREKLKKDKKIAQELDEAIEEIIAAEIAKEKPESNLVGVDFLSYRNNFEWPTEGIVSKSFGRQLHPTIPNVFITNNGIDIRTESNAAAKAIFPGTVIHVVYIPGANNAVIVRHGDYYTVYKNLIDVTVEPGEEVVEGKELGKVFFDKEEEVAELHFEIRHQTEKLNPLLWLKKK